MAALMNSGKDFCGVGAGLFLTTDTAWNFEVL
jgi:hypothetical protein